MASRRLPAIIAFENEMNTAFPNRDRSSDGEVGDARHAESVSNHNRDESGNTGRWHDADKIDEVHARDTDRDLRTPGWRMEMVLAILLDRVRRGVEKRITEIIFDGYIYTKARGWTKRKYSGSNPHDKHIHLSYAYGSGSGQDNPENITTPYGILTAVRESQKPVKPAPTDPKWSDMATKQEVKDACREALSEFLWDAYNASQNTEAYKKATADRQKVMRNARDTFAAVAADDIKGAIDRIELATVKPPNPPAAKPKA